MLEEPDAASWRFNPDAPANHRLYEFIMDWTSSIGRNMNMGRQLRRMLLRFSGKPVLRAHILALPSGHVYGALALMLGTAFRDALAERIGAEEIDSLLARAEEELRDPELWSTSCVRLP